MHRVCAILLILFFPLAASATLHYSYDLSESLKPLIEWREYGQDAFRESVVKNKPIFLLLTAPSWCHWCQVYESEEYLFAPSVVEKINNDTIPIYVDADRRQDLTRHYLEGGWPSTTLFTPNRERITGFSGPRPPSILLSLINQSTQFVQQNGFMTETKKRYIPQTRRLPTNDTLQALISRYLFWAENAFDTVYGGFGTSLKFPQPRTLLAFLERYEESNETKWKDRVELTLQNQYTHLSEIETNYNLWDPVEYGFHRYGTTREYTPPHYEKMLYDNARFLKTYSRLAELTDNPLAEEVSDKTYAFLNSWYDNNGGFAANADAYTEHRYFGSSERTDRPPRIEWTKYTDWNADAIDAYFERASRLKDRDAFTKAHTSLLFFINKMVDENGAYHFFTPEGEKGVQGNLSDNAAIVFVATSGLQSIDALCEEGYVEETICTQDRKIILARAQEVADVALDTLYDWKSGGFFERHSQDSSLYAADEMLILDQPIEENGLMAYALLRLYNDTKDLRYLLAGIRTIGRFQSDTGSLDAGFYLYKASKLTVEKDLLETFQLNRKAVESIEKEGEKTFFLTQPLVKASIEVPPEKEASGSLILLVFLSFLAGLLSFLSPCTLPILPAYIASSLKTHKDHQVLMSVSFIAGLTILFALLGMSASLIGQFLKSHLVFFTQMAGILIVIFGIMILCDKGFKGLQIAYAKPQTMLTSFLFGGALGLSWTPCIGPILVAILAVASTTESALRGGLLLFVYGLGLGLPLIVLSTSVKHISDDNRIWNNFAGKKIRISIAGKEWTIYSPSLLSGLLLIVLGILIFSGKLTVLNQLATGLPYQQLFFIFEEYLTQLMHP